MTDKIGNILEQRGSRYGLVEEQFVACNAVKKAVRMHSLFRRDSSVAKFSVSNDDLAVVIEALDMIATKMSRIMAGDPTYRDNWDDIAGYARLVSEYFDRTKEAQNA